MEAKRFLDNVKHTPPNELSNIDKEIVETVERVFAELDDDFNTPKALARLFELFPLINSYKDNKPSYRDISDETMQKLQACFSTVLIEIMGLEDDMVEEGNSTDALGKVMELVIDLRQSARANKDWSTADKIRDDLAAQNIVIKDGKEGTSWSLN